MAKQKAEKERENAIKQTYENWPCLRVTKEDVDAFYNANQDNFDLNKLQGNKRKLDPKRIEGWTSGAICAERYL